MSGACGTVGVVDADTVLAGLDDDQRQVVQAWGAPVAVLAGAGTGKTRVITHRIAYGALTGSIDPGATLALTFTTTAAAEIRERLARMGVAHVQARTFHSACLRQAQFFWPEVYHAALPPVVDKRDGLIAQACERLGIAASEPAIREIDQEIAWTKQTNVTPEAYVALAAADHRRLASLTPESMADALVAYEEAKQVACVVDLDDLLLCTVALLATEPSVARRVRTTYRHFVFDEFQDVSPVQSRLVELWVGGRADVTVVGDPAQTIHGFAGARSVYLEHFADTHPGTLGLTLTRNYRSTAPILRAAARAGGGTPLTAVRGTGPAVELAAAPDELEESANIAAWLQARHDDGVAWGDMAVLYRTRRGPEAIRQILADQSVPFGGDGVTLATLHAAKGREWEAVAIGGLSEATMPHPLATGPAQVAEERRTLYVGMTRARTYLRLSWPTTVAGRPVAVSPFLSDAA